MAPLPSDGWENPVRPKFCYLTGSDRRFLAGSFGDFRQKSNFELRWNTVRMAEHKGSSPFARCTSKNDVFISGIHIHGLTLPDWFYSRGSTSLYPLSVGKDEILRTLTPLLHPLVERILEKRYRVDWIWSLRHTCRIRYRYTDSMYSSIGSKHPPLGLSGEGVVPSFFVHICKKFFLPSHFIYSRRLSSDLSTTVMTRDSYDHIGDKIMCH